VTCALNLKSTPEQQNTHLELRRVFCIIPGLLAAPWRESLEWYSLFRIPQDKFTLCRVLEISIAQIGFNILLLIKIHYFAKPIRVTRIVMNPEILKIIYCITAFQLFFFGCITLLLKPQRNYNNWLSAFLFLKFLILSLELGMWYLNWFTLSRTIFILDSILNYLLCPVFYLYVFHLAQLKLKFKPLQLLMLVPFIIIITINCLGADMWHQYSRLLIQIAVINYNVQALIYFILSGICYRKLKILISENHTRDIIEKVKWLKIVITGFIVLWIISGIGESIRIYANSEYILFDATIEITFLIIVNLLIFLAARQPVFQDLQNEKTVKYEFSSLTESEKDSILIKLDELMKLGKFFRTPELSLKLLSSRLNIQSKHLSQVINEKLRLNFCEYINMLRIEDAKDQLSDPRYSGKTILEIIYASGFNSKSVFNTVFKELTGTTPTTYRNNKLRNIA
jgi:AraC-like DNA-binding protein